MEVSAKVKNKYKRLGIRITEFRKERNITIEELSVKTGISVEYLKRIEQGSAYNISLTQHIFKIEKELGFKLSDLFD